LPASVKTSPTAPRPVVPPPAPKVAATQPTMMAQAPPPVVNPLAPTPAAPQPPPQMKTAQREGPVIAPLPTSAPPPRAPPARAPAPPPVARGAVAKPYKAAYTPPSKGAFGSFSRALAFMQQIFSLAGQHKALFKPLVWDVLLTTPLMAAFTVLEFFVHS